MTNASLNHREQPGVQIPATFTVQVCSMDGRLLSEYCLSNEDHDVRTLAAAEQNAVMNLSDLDGEQLIIVVSEETLTKIRQVHLLVAPANDKEI